MNNAVNLPAEERKYATGRSSEEIMAWVTATIAAHPGRPIHINITTIGGVNNFMPAPNTQQQHPNYIYFIRTSAAADKIRVKIGRSVNPAKRLATLQTGCPRKLSLLATIATIDQISAAGLEARLHRIHSAKRIEVGRRVEIGGEWFEFTQTELDQAVDGAWALVLGDTDDSS